MSSSWPDGVTTLKDMHRYAETLVGNHKIENLLTGTPFDNSPGRFLIRVKGACNTGEWKSLAGLLEKANRRSKEVPGLPLPVVEPDHFISASSLQSSQSGSAQRLKEWPFRANR